MFDSLLGRKFSAKCKQSIKHIKSRVCERRKKKQALLNFLKKDIADLLAINEESNAFGRMDGLILEMNHVDCYDMIEKFCEHIVSQLPTLQKQRECSEEAMESVATLIYAAARFSDLPELCDLRCAFTTRYGSAMEPFVNQEFVDKISKKAFSKERKLKMMQEIANEFSIEWDSKDYGQKKSVPNIRCQSEIDFPEVPIIMQNGTAANEVHTIPGHHKGNFFKVPIIVQNGTAANEVHTIPGHKKDMEEPAKAPFSQDRIDHKRQAVGMRSSDTRTIDISPHVKLNEHGNGVHENRGCKDDHMFATEKQPVGSLKQEKFKPVNIAPPYIKHNGLKNGSPADETQPAAKGKQTDGPVNFNVIPPTTEKQHVGSLKQEKIKPVNIAHPYVKHNGLKNGSPTDETQPAAKGKQTDGPVNFNGIPPINRIPPYFKPSADKIEGRTDHKAKENVDSQNDDLVGEGKPKPRSVRRNKHILSSNNHQRGEDVAAVFDADERIDQIVYGRRRGDRRGTRSFDADYDEDDRALDRLLMHYSSKGVAARPDKLRKAKKDLSVCRNVEISEAKTMSDHVLARVSSLPPERTNATDVNASVASPSVHPNNVNARGKLVHPRLPDYDELAARFNALKKS